MRLHEVARVEVDPVEVRTTHHSPTNQTHPSDIRSCSETIEQRAHGTYSLSHERDFRDIRTQQDRNGLRNALV